MLFPEWPPPMQSYPSTLLRGMTAAVCRANLAWSSLQVESVGNLQKHLLLLHGGWYLHMALLQSD